MTEDHCPNCNEAMLNIDALTPEEMTCEDYYKDPIAHHSTQKTKLKDFVPNMAFYNAMFYNADLFKDKIVLDVGCQSGLLCLFAAQMGAAKVIGIESSSASRFAEIAVEKSLYKGKITIIKSKIEEAKLPDSIEKVDIIISEWIGYSLFHESILQKVIFSRDKWLKPGGYIFPDKANLYIAAIEKCQRRDEQTSYWDNVYGFTMKSIRKVCLSEAKVETISPRDFVSHPFLLREIDLYSIKMEDLEFSSNFCLQVKHNDYVQAFVTYFDVEFTKCSPPVIFSTCPSCYKTRWRQTVFYIDKDLVVAQGEYIKGIFSVKKGTTMTCGIQVEFEGALYQLKEKYMFEFSNWN